MVLLADPLAVGAHRLVEIPVAVLVVRFLLEILVVEMVEKVVDSYFRVFVLPP